MVEDGEDPLARSPFGKRVTQSISRKREEGIITTNKISSPLLLLLLLLHHHDPVLTLRITHANKRG